MNIPKNAYIPAVKEPVLPPAQEKLRETNRFMFIVKHHRTMSVNDMARAMKIGYTQVQSRIQLLRKKGFDIRPLKMQKPQPNWDVVQREYDKVMGKKAKK